jgi:hypothetical protein
MLVLENRRYSAFVGGDDDGTKEQKKVNGYLVGILTKYSRQIIDILEELELLKTDGGEGKTTRRKSKRLSDVGDESKADHKDVLVRRWKQIRDMVNTAIDELGA